MSTEDDLFTPEGFARHADRLAQENTGAVSRQHVVSRVVLKRFAEKNSRNGRELMAFNLEYGQGRRRGVAECGKIVDLIDVASGSAERLWQTVENELPPVLDAIEAGALLSDAQAKIAKSAVALHIVRSPYWRHTASNASEKVKWRMTETYVGRFRKSLSNEFHKRTGLWVDDREILIEEFLRFIAEYEIHSAKLDSRAQLDRLFPRVIGVLDGMSIDIVSAGPGQEFLISDAPAVPFRYDSPKIGRPLGLLNAHAIVLPLTPQRAIYLARGIGLKATTGFLNQLQIRHAYRHVYYRPASSLGTFVTSNAFAWSKPTAIAEHPWE